MQITHSESAVEEPACWLLVDSSGVIVLVEAFSVVPAGLKVMEVRSVEGAEVFEELLDERADDVVGNSKRAKFEGEHEKRVSSNLNFKQ